MSIEPEAFARATFLVRDEQARYLAQPGTLSIDGYFNNWRLYLPNPAIQPGGGAQRQIAIGTGLWDITYREFCKLVEEEPTYLYSDKFLDRVTRDFYADIDASLADRKISPDSIHRLQRRLARQLKGITGLIDAITELHECTLPAFIQLRAMGYSRYDLTG